MIISLNFRFLRILISILLKHQVYLLCEIILGEKIFAVAEEHYVASL